MTVAQLERRINALEKTVEQLKSQLAKNGEKPAENQEPWWRTEAGRFANDPVFDEIVRLGREYRESLRPGRARKKKPAKGKAK